ncbi:MAG: sigma-70 family RNA polymerase sigma factor [Steroidobacteraceae bacterium]
MDAAAEPDEALVARYAAGDVAAFEMLYARHELPLWRYLLRQCGDHGAAEELMQEVWFTVTREAPRFRPQGRFTAWLYTLARHRLIDRHRTTHHHRSLDTADTADGSTLGELLADECAPSPLEESQRAEQGEAILAALARLPAEQREAFVLQAESGMSVEEIATVTGTPFETAKSRLRYARDRLKALLRDHAS